MIRSSEESRAFDWAALGQIEGSGVFASGDVGPPSRSETDDFWFLPMGPQSSSGVHVTHTSALQATVVYACVRAISEAVGTLPLITYRREPNGDKVRADNHPIRDILHDQANDEQTAAEAREQLLAWALMRGTAIAEKVPGRRGPVDQLVPLHPDHARPIQVTDGQGRVQWQIEHREPGAPTRRLLRDEVFILRGLNVGPDRICGLDPITVQAQAVGASLAADDYAGRLFANQAIPAGIVQWDGHFDGPESQENWKRAWQRAFGGANRFRTAVLERGMKYQAVSMRPDQAQFLETRQYNAVDICRIFRCPPHKAGILDEAKWANIEQQALEWVSDTLGPWLVRFEQAIKRDLIIGRQFFAEHNVAGLLRGDLESRYQAYAVGRNWGWLSVNEIRRLENMNAIEDGDLYLQPLNMTPAGEPGEPSGQGQRRQPRQRAPGALQNVTHTRAGVCIAPTYSPRA